MKLTKRKDIKMAVTLKNGSRKECHHQCFRSEIIVKQDTIDPNKEFSYFKKCENGEYIVVHILDLDGNRVREMTLTTDKTEMINQPSSMWWDKVRRNVLFDSELESFESYIERVRNEYIKLGFEPVLFE